METYNIIGTIVLSFIINDEQRDILFDKDNPGILESNGVTVWYVTKEGERHESITTANIIEVGLRNKALSRVFIIDLEMCTVKIEAPIRRFRTMMNPDEDIK